MSNQKFRVGSRIEINHGYDGDIRSNFTITKLSDDLIYLDWDSPWFPIKDEPRRNIKVVSY